MNIQKLNVTDIVPSPYNPRISLEKGSIEYKNIENSINEFGFVEPLVVNGVNMHCIGGHQRLQVLKDLGETEVECVVINEPDSAREKALCVALNKIDGDWDMDKLAVLLADDEVNIFPTGFGEGEVDLSLYLDSEFPDVDEMDQENETSDDSDSESSDEDAIDNGSTVIKIGTFSINVTIAEYENLIRSIRDMGIFDQEGIKDEMKRRLLSDTDSAD